MISHDRDFMDELVETVYDIENAKLVRYTGNYSTFIELKEQRYELLLAAWRNQQREIAHIESFVDRFRSVASKAAQVQSRIKQLEKIQRIEKPRPARKVFKFIFPQPQRSTQRVIELEHVSQSYGVRRIYSDLNLLVERGQRIVLVGPNGAGKTTTIKMMTGILEITKGDILIDNNSIIKSPIEAKKKLGLVQDNPEIFLKLKGIEYLNFIADIYEISTKERIKKIKELSEKFEMQTVLNNKMQSYSHGMRQKIIIMGVLLHNPKNLIFDEPMTGLDPKSSFDLKQIMKEYAKNNNTVFFSTHILEVAERLCDRIAIINKGKIIFIGTYEEMKKEFKKNVSLEELFMEITNND